MALWYNSWKSFREIMICKAVCGKNLSLEILITLVLATSTQRKYCHELRFLAAFLVSQRIFMSSRTNVMVGWAKVSRAGRSENLEAKPASRDFSISVGLPNKARPRQLSLICMYRTGSCYLSMGLPTYILLSKKEQVSVA
jgi:hypothetical protein